MISKQEYIAVREAEASYYAILYAAKLAEFSFDVIDTKKLRSLVQEATGFPFSELAVAKALQAPDAYSFATAVSQHSQLGSYKFDKAKMKEKYELLSLSEKSGVWQLENVEHAEFRAKVAAERKRAIERYEIDKNFENPIVAPWTELNMNLMDGLFLKSVSWRMVRQRSPESLFNRGAFKPEWLCVYLAAIAILVAIWIG